MMRLLHCMMALALCAALASAQSQSLRDPTVSPVEAGIAGAPTARNSPQIGAGSTNVVVRNGRPYLLVGTRLYGQGEQFGQARIERISETEVWLREAGELRKVQRFGSVERRVASSPRSSIDCAPSAMTPARPVQTGKATRTRKPNIALVKPGFPIRSAAVAPCVGVRP